MKIKAKLLSLTGGLSESILCFSIKGKDALSSLEKYKDREVYLEIKKPSKKRSLDSNSYFWTLCEDLADEWGVDKETVYIEMLLRFGKFTHIIVKPEAVDRVRREWRASEVYGTVLVNGEEGVQIRCCYGSHNYDQSEMNKLILGTIRVCEENNICTMTPDEIAAMNEGWGV